VVINSDEEDEDVDDPKRTKSTALPVKTPVQDTIKTEISVLESQLNSATLARDSGLGDSKAAQELVEKLRKEIKAKKQLLDRKIKKAQYEQKYRKERREAYKNIVEKNPDLAKKIKVSTALSITLSLCDFIKLHAYTGIFYEYLRCETQLAAPDWSAISLTC